MKNTKKFIIPAFLFAMTFVGSQSAFASTDFSSHKFALLNPSTVLSNLEVSGENKIEINNKNRNDSHVDIKANFNASTDTHGDKEDKDTDIKTRANASSTMGAGSKGDDHWDNRTDGNRGNNNHTDSKEGNENNRPWFSWFGRMFGQFRSHGTTTASTTVSTTSTITADVYPPMIFKKIRFITASSTTTVTWNTNEQTYGEVRFATSTASGTPSTLVLDNNLSASHTVTLTGMSTSTDYFVTIIAKDTSGNTSTSGTIKYSVKDGLTNVTLDANIFIRMWHSIFG